MYIVYSSNDDYVPFLGISLFSLLENNRELSDLYIFILSDQISPGNCLKLTDMCRSFEREIQIIEISDFRDSIPFEFHTAGFHPVILSRLFLCTYLPEAVRQVLYLDCDTVVSGSLKSLDEISLGEYYAAAVPELYMPPSKKALIGHTRAETYYNSGVLLINLALWRRDSMESAFLKYYQQMNGKLLYIDQDIINHCCKNRILCLQQRYNLSPNLRYFPRYFVKRLQPAYESDSREAFNSNLEYPVIIHFMGDERPWIHGNRNAYRMYFNKYKQLSPWNDLPVIMGQEWYMLCYHILNVITVICPWFRIFFSNVIGINKYLWFGKK